MKNKFVNPQSLKGKDLHNKVLALMGKLAINESTNVASAVEQVKIGPDGKTYGIVREGHKYFIKIADVLPGTAVMVEDFKYIGGLANKNKERYDSYADALKRLNIKFDAINESLDLSQNINMFESDITVEKKVEEPIEEEKFVLKVKDADTEAAPAPEPTEEPVSDDIDDGDMFGSESGSPEDAENIEEPAGEMETADNTEISDEEISDEDDPVKAIQKMTGKIGQMMRAMEEPDLDLEKYVINSVISAMHLKDLDKEDKLEIIKKIKKGGLKDAEEGAETEGTEEGAEGEDDPMSVFADFGGEEGAEGEEVAAEEGSEDEKEPKKESRVLTKSSILEMFMQEDELDFDLTQMQPDGTIKTEVVDVLDTNPTVKPTVKPDVKPDVKPHRRSAPFTKPQREIKPGQEPFPDPAPKNVHERFGPGFEMRNSDESDNGGYSLSFTKEYPEKKLFVIALNGEDKYVVNMFKTDASKNKVMDLDTQQKLSIQELPHEVIDLISI